MSPGGINEAVRKQIRTMAGNRCGYCRSLQKYVLGMLEIDHIMALFKTGLHFEKKLATLIEHLF